MKQAEEMRSAVAKPEWKLRQKYKMFISSLMRQTTLWENGNYNLTVTDWRCHCCYCTPTNNVASWPTFSRSQQLSGDQAWAVGGEPTQGLCWLCHLHHHHLFPPQLFTPLQGLRFPKCHSLTWHRHMFCHILLPSLPTIYFNIFIHLIYHN